MIPQKRDGVRAREIDGETVILDESGGRMHNLNCTASYIFGEVDGQRSVDEISRDLSDTFGIPLDRASSDTRNFLGILRDRGLLV